MGDMMKKVRSGERLRIPARTFNTFIDAARDFEARQRNQQQDPKRRFASNGIVPVKNASGADRDRFDILGIDAPIFTPSDNEESFKNQVALKGVTPTAADHTGRFVVLLEPAKSGAIVPGLVQGISPVRVDIQDEDHEFADVADGECGQLRSGTTGSAQILWKENGTGVKWAVVRLGLPYRRGFWARLTSEASGGGGYYSWKMLEDDAETPVDPPVTGTDNAKEVNETEGLPVGGSDGAVVWLEKDTTDDPVEWRFAHPTSLKGDLDPDTGVSTFAEDSSGEGKIQTEIVDGQTLIKEVRQTACWGRSDWYTVCGILNVAWNRWGELVAIQDYWDQWYDLDGNPIDPP